MLRAKDIKRIYKNNIAKNSIDGLSPMTIQHINHAMNTLFPQQVTPSFAPLKTSTITTKCQLNKNVNLAKIALIVYERICAGDPLVFELKFLNTIYNHDLNNPATDAAAYIQQKNAAVKPGKVPYQVFRPIARALAPTAAVAVAGLEKTHMGNSITLRLKLTAKIINLKLFQNGKITITGCKEPRGEDGLRCVEWLLALVSADPAIYYNDILAPPRYSAYKEIMYNTCFTFAPALDQYKLYEILLKTGLYISFNPEISAPIHMIFMWNDDHEEKDGICKCGKSCIIDNRKKAAMKKRYVQAEGANYRKGVHEYNCKAVTVNIYSTSVIITGDDTLPSIEFIREFIIGIIRDNFAAIVQRAIWNQPSDRFNFEPMDDGKAPLAQLRAYVRKYEF